MAGIAGVPKSPVACLPITPSGALVSTVYWDSPRGVPHLPRCLSTLGRKANSPKLPRSSEPWLIASRQKALIALP